jgi:secondary thiamine-phosphate synthase enzyme
MQSQVVVRTSRRIEALDLTDIVLAQELLDGLVLVSLPHTTAALLLSEADADLLVDLEKVASGWATGFEPFRHHKNDNPNAAAHLLSALAGSQVIILVEGGKAQLGQFQRLVLLELDGPKERHVRLHALGSASVVQP